MYKKNSLIPTLIIQTFCSIVLMYVAIVSTNAKVWASSLQVVPATPQPFLGPIYYGSKYVYNVFDHWSPCASVCVDPNNDVLHYNGTIYFGVTGTPDATASPTPTHWPSATPYIPDDGYGYDEHAGIDYGLQYVPVLAAADGKVTVANWHHPSNHHLGFGLYVQLLHEEHDSYSTLGELWLAGAQGEPAVRLDEVDAGHGYPPVWSSDGDTLIYVKRENPNSTRATYYAELLHSNIYQVNIHTGTVIPLTQFSATLVYDVVWSPDGQQLAFTDGDAVWLLRPGESPVAISPPGLITRHPVWLVAPAS